MGLDANTVADLDDDLPTEAPTAQPRDPANGQFLPSSPPARPARSAAAPEPVLLSAYALAKAREYGVDPEGMNQGQLDQVLSSIESHRAGVARQQAQARAAQQDAAKAKADPPPVDWGEDDNGNALTEEQARKLYPRPVFNAIKNQHKLDSLAEENKKLRESIEQDRQQRSARAALRQIHDVLATRPDLFGEKPGDAEEGTAEYERYQLALAHIGRQFQLGKQSTPKADAAKAVALFGPAAQKPTAKPNGRPALDYSAGELARPTGRRGGEVISRREAMIRSEAERLKENGSLVHAAFGDDDDDLPD